MQMTGTLDTSTNEETYGTMGTSTDLMEMNGTLDTSSDV